MSGRVVKPALTSFNCPIRGSSPDGTPLTYHSVKFVINLLSPIFSFVDLLYFIMSGIIRLLLLTDLGIA